MKLTEEQIQALKALSGNNNYNDLLQRPKKQLERIIWNYQQTEPVINDLNSNGIKINNLEDPLYPNFSNDLYKKAIPILVAWLRKDSLDPYVKASLVRVLIQKPISKKYAFDIIINQYKTADREYRDKWGIKSDLTMMLVNGLLRWADDAHADEILQLVKKENSLKNNLLWLSLANFKQPENIKKATTLLIEELRKSNLPNARIGTLINALRKLNATGTRELIYPFTNFPENYKRTIEIDPKEYGYVTDGEVRREAKKAIAKFDKLLK